MGVANVKSGDEFLAVCFDTSTSIPIDEAEIQDGLGARFGVVCLGDAGPAEASAETVNEPVLVSE